MTPLVQVDVDSPALAGIAAEESRLGAAVRRYLAEEQTDPQAPVALFNSAP